MNEPQLIIVGRRGRPSRAGTRSTARVEIVLTCEEKTRLEQVARENGSKVSSVVRDAVNSFVADYSESRGVLVTRR